MKSKRKCSFCGTEYTEKEIKDFKRVLFKSPMEDDIRICDNCLQHCEETLEQLKNSMESKKEVQAVDMDLTPDIIKQGLDEWIIGQEKAKYKVSIALYNHYKRLRKKTDVKIQKSNIMLVGPTGSGKTEIVRALAEQLKVPYTIEDVTNITSAGYVGRDADEILKNLITAANGDIKKAEKGIVFLDEGDKLRRKGRTVSGQKDVNGEGVQQGLLKMVEGGVVEIKKDRNGLNTYKFDTTDVLFIMGGAFEGVDKIISERLKKKNNKNSIGIGASIDSKQETPFNNVIDEIKHEDLMEFGMTPELLGRFPIVAPLHELTTEALMNILTEPKHAIVKQYTELFNMDDIELEITPKALEAIANKAKERKVGARALRSVMEDVLEEAMYKAPSVKNISKVKITDDLNTEYETAEEAVEL